MSQEGEEDERSRYRPIKKARATRRLLLADAYRAASVTTSKVTDAARRDSFRAAVDVMPHGTLLGIVETLLMGRMPYPSGLRAERQAIAGMMGSVYLRKMGIVLLPEKVIDDPRSQMLLEILREADARNIPPLYEDSLFIEFAARSAHYNLIGGRHGLWDYMESDCSGGEWFVAVRQIWETYQLRMSWGLAESLLDGARCNALDWPERARKAADAVEAARVEFDGLRQAATDSLKDWSSSTDSTLYPNEIIAAFPELCAQWERRMDAQNAKRRPAAKRKPKPKPVEEGSQEINDGAVAEPPAE